MSIINFLELKEKFEIQPYQKLGSVDKADLIPFSGSPRKHPHEASRVILIADPFTDNTFYYEFQVDDIACAEELPSMTNMKGKSVSMVRLWLKKQTIAIRCTPFIVDAIKRK